MLKKRFAAAVAAVCMFAGINASAKTIEITVGEPDVYVSEQTVEHKTVDSAPYIENGRTMVPIRFISENFDAAVDWNEAQQKVTVTSGESVVELFVGNKISYINGEQKELEAAPVIANGRTMVPLRFVSEAFGKFVEYVDASKQITISDLPPVLDVNGELFSIEDYKFVILTNNIPTDKAVLAEAIPDITQYLAQIGSVYSESKKSENALVKENAELETKIVDSVMKDKASLYKFALASTAIKQSVMYNYATEYIMQSVPTISEEDIAETYKNEYVHVKHILVSTVDEETGEPLGNADKTKAKKEAQEALKKAKNGEDFDKLIEKYNDDPGMVANPDGYTFTKNQMVKEFEEASFALKENEISDIVETSYGYHIIQKLPLPEVDNYVKQVITDNIMANATNAFVSDIIVNADVKQYITDENLIKLITE